MSDISGSRFLRMAGSDQFQQSLNKKAYDFTYDPAEGSVELASIQKPDVSYKEGLAYTPEKGLEYKDTSNDYIPIKKRFAADKVQNQIIDTGTGSNDYSMFERQEQPKYKNKSSTIQGPGEFDAQVQREKDLLGSNFQDQGNSFSDFKNTYAMPNSADDDIFGIANAAIRSAAANNPMNVQALDQQIRTAPLYHESKSKLEGLRTFGDVARWSREDLPEFKLPAPMEAVETPDFDKMYDRTRDDLDELKIK